jgi:hypothetical protein
MHQSDCPTVPDRSLDLFGAEQHFGSELREMVRIFDLPLLARNQRQRQEAAGLMS